MIAAEPAVLFGAMCFLAQDDVSGAPDADGVYAVSVNNPAL